VSGRKFQGHCGDYDYETQHYVKHMLDFFNATGIRKASVIGLSLGARVGSRFAIDYPEMVDKLILLQDRLQRPTRRGIAFVKFLRACYTMKARYGRTSLLRDCRSAADPI
jgi:pimeloyl-ACP methyl ester carboxylesterase